MDASQTCVRLGPTPLAASSDAADAALRRVRAKPPHDSEASRRWPASRWCESLGIAEMLAGVAEVYVIDAFGTAHRAHASTEGVVKHIDGPAAGGVLMEKELVYIKGAIDAPKRPLTAILGGAKVSTKIPVIESMLDKCDNVLVGGGMIFTFYKAQGHSVGGSLIEEDYIDMARDLLAKAEAKGVKFLLPKDVVVAD